MDSQPADNVDGSLNLAKTSDINRESCVSGEAKEGEQGEENGSRTYYDRITRSRSSCNPPNRVNDSLKLDRSSEIGKKYGCTQAVSMENSLQNSNPINRLLEVVNPSDVTIESCVAREATRRKCQDKEKGSEIYCGRTTRSRSSTQQPSSVNESAKLDASSYPAKEDNGINAQSIGKLMQQLDYTNELPEAIKPVGELVGRKTRSQTACSYEGILKPVTSSCIADRRVTRSRSGAMKKSLLASSLNRLEGYACQDSSGSQVISPCLDADVIVNQDGHAETVVPSELVSEGLVEDWPLLPSNDHLVVKPKQLAFYDMEEYNLNNLFSPLKAEFSDKGFFADVERAQMAANSSKHSTGKLEKRVTRSSSRGNANEIAVKTSNGKCAEFSDKGVLSFEKKSKLVVNSSEQLMGKLKKKMTSRYHRGITDKHAKKNGGSKCNGLFECATTELVDKGVLSKEEKDNLGVDLCEKFTGKLQKRTVTVGGGEREGKDMHKEHKHIGVKRKRDQLKECRGIVQGWTNDQEMALQRAYFAAKPTPHFWKKVARLVPGKSAQDCFDKVHSDHLTPPQLQPRSRARTNSSSLSHSASELLNPTGPKINYRKQKSRLGQKKVRKLLQKNYQVDQNYAADLFSVLEPTCSPFMVLYTPDQNKEKLGLLKRCQQRSSSGHKKPISRHNSLRGATLVSPPVLKQIKNKVLHEKYIDQLHCREAKRRAAFARSAKCGQGKEGKKESYVQEMDSIKAAKNALVFDARDAIDQFQYLQANAMSSFFDADDGVDSYEVEDDD